jgi:hypothetical protein
MDSFYRDIMSVLAHIGGCVLADESCKLLLRIKDQGRKLTFLDQLFIEVIEKIQER